MFSFENKLTQNGGIHYSRFIASWYNKGGEKITSYGPFRDWLYSLGFLTEKEIDDICEMATNGKLELEMSAKRFIYEHK